MVPDATALPTPRWQHGGARAEEAAEKLAQLNEEEFDEADEETSVFGQFLAWAWERLASPVTCCICRDGKGDSMGQEDGASVASDAVCLTELASSERGMYLADSPHGVAEAEVDAILVQPRKLDFTEAKGEAIEHAALEAEALAAAAAMHNPWALQPKQPAEPLEGLLERRGLRLWNVLWVTMFVHLDVAQGILYIYDEDEEEGRTLHAATTLTADMWVERLTALTWRIQLPPSAAAGGARDELSFLWRAPDVATAGVWILGLELACASSGGGKRGSDSPRGSVGLSLCSTAEATSPSGDHDART